MPEFSRDHIYGLIFWREIADSVIEVHSCGRSLSLLWHGVDAVCWRCYDIGWCRNIRLFPLIRACLSLLYAATIFTAKDNDRLFAIFFCTHYFYNTLFSMSSGFA